LSTLVTINRTVLLAGGRIKSKEDGFARFGSQVNNFRFRHPIRGRLKCPLANQNHLKINDFLEKRQGEYQSPIFFWRTNKVVKDIMDTFNRFCVFKSVD
jgi:hypothetical protein